MINSGSNLGSPNGYLRFNDDAVNSIRGLIPSGEGEIVSPDGDGAKTFASEFSNRKVSNQITWVLQISLS